MFWTTINVIIVNFCIIVENFKHSLKATLELKKIHDKISEHKLIQCVVTRWNSAYHTLERIYGHKNSIASFLGDAKSLQSFDGNKWDLNGFFYC